LAAALRLQGYGGLLLCLPLLLLLLHLPVGAVVGQAVPLLSGLPVQCR
jgi:hypothetical protein